MSVITLIVMLFVGWIVWYEKSEIVRNDRHRTELFARLLDDHAGRTLDVAALALSDLSEVAKVNGDTLRERLRGPVLQLVGSLSFIRSLALVDASGSILLSSRDSETGLQFSMDMLGALPGNDAAVLSRLIPARYLEDLTQPTNQQSASFNIYSLPLLRRVQIQEDRNLYLVALINPDFFANFQAVALGEADYSAVMASYAGDVLASYPQALPLGVKLPNHFQIIDQLKPRAQGSYIGPGAGEGEQIVSVRTSRAWPLVTLVERPMAAALNDWFRLLFWFVLVGEMAMIVIAVMARIAWRSVSESARIKAEFIANVSHELRTPLQSILGFSELGVMQSGQNSRMMGMFSDIHRSGQRMLALVNDLLDISKIESTFSDSICSQADARDLVHDVERELAPLLRARQVGLDLKLPEQALMIQADVTRIHQVLRNVVANALKFSSPGQRITIGLEPVRADSLLFYVQDQGCGIPQDELENIFEPFVQSSFTKDGSGGTGLGLAICRQIVQVHGGTIHAENIAAGGAIFYINLPLGIPNAPAGQSIP